jgi:WD40 repeat protein
LRETGKAMRLPVAQIGHHYWTLEPSKRLLALSTDEGVRIVSTTGSAHSIPALVEPGPRVLTRDHTDQPWLLAPLTPERVAVWRLDAAQIEQAHHIFEPLPAAIQSLAIASDKRWLLAVDDEGQAYVWRLDPSSLRPVAGPRLLAGRAALVSQSAYASFFSAHSLLVLSLAGSDRIGVWRLPDEGLPDPEPFSLLAAHAGRPLGIARLEDRFLTWSSDRRVRVWSVDALEHPIDLVHDTDPFYASFDPTGERVASITAEPALYLWSLADPSLPQRSHRGLSSRGRSVGFSPDGQAYALTSDAGLLLWTDDESEPLMLASTTALLDLDWLDGGRLLSYDEHGQTRLWLLGEQRDGPALLERLWSASETCPSIVQRMHFSGESQASAETAARACLERLGRVQVR